MGMNKTQYYGVDGTGRDTYIYMANGGFCPEKQPTGIEEIGSFVTTKARPAEPMAYIHSKPVKYTNNGGGRDTYISDSAGGLNLMYQPAYNKRTFYNNLRQYPIIDNQAYRSKSHTASYVEKKDIYWKSQDHWNRAFSREMRLVGNYQRMLDTRLSVPKTLQKVSTNTSSKDEKIFKNSAYNKQQNHQSVFTKFSALQGGGGWAKDSGNDNTNDLNAAKANYVSHLEKSFSESFKRYDQLDRNQKLNLIKQIKY